MHTSMNELLENLKTGLLWVGADGVVRYANRHASQRTGLGIGRRVSDPELARAIVFAAVGQVTREVTLKLGATQGHPGVEVDCRVIPALDGDDAFVFVGGNDEPDCAAGIDTMMQAIRQDLRDPLRSARAALDLARTTGDETRDGLEIEALCDCVDRVLQVADKLVDLGTLWSGGSLLADDRIELWPMLQQVWGDVEPLAIERRVRVRFTTDAGARELAALYGSERWIRRVLTECLQGAVRAAPESSELEIEHLQTGARASIVLRDCPLFAEPLRGEAAISLKLCRHVLALHGGRLREEIEGGSRHLAIELPTGAPHRNDESQLAIAQAHHYARDLAALMTRTRRTGRVADADAGTL